MRALRTKQINPLHSKIEIYKSFINVYIVQYLQSNLKEINIVFVKFSCQNKGGNILRH